MGKATRESYGIALLELGKLNEDVVVLDADLSKSTKTNEFSKLYPERFFNIGIAEQNLMGVSAGLSNIGKIPFASTFAVFATGRAFEVIRNSICYPRMNVKIAATHAGITVGEDGGSHQSIEDIAIMCALPNMTVIAPADHNETIEAVKAIANFDGPVYLRLGRCETPEIYSDDYKFKIGCGSVLRKGTDITLIAIGMMVHEALEAAKILKNEGIEARVINMSTIKPIDRELVIAAAKETKGIITIEEHSIIGGLGDTVSGLVSSVYPTRVEKIGINDVFGESGQPKELMEKFGLTSDEIVKRVRKILLGGM